jgi:hypothetical protein
MKHLTRLGLLLLAAPFVFGQEGDSFRSTALRIEVTRPSGWEWVSTQQSVQNQRRFVPGDPRASTGNLPVVRLAKYRADADSLSASVAIHHYDLGGPRVTPGQVSELILAQVRKALHESRITLGPRSMELSGFPGSYTQLTTVAKAKTGKLATLIDMWVVVRGRDVFLIESEALWDNDDSQREGLADIVNSIGIYQ